MNKVIMELGENVIMPEIREQVKQHYLLWADIRRDTRLEKARKQRSLRVYTSSGLKHCYRCGISYPATLEYFTAEVRNKDGLYSYCKECKNEMKRISRNNT